MSSQQKKKGEAVEEGTKQAAQPFDTRDFRRALGQFATGVTVVTAITRDGRRIGMTVNSFSSVSLDPPLVLWSIARNAASFQDFTTATHFGVNVLAADQHHLSKQFSTPLEDKFAGVACHGSACVPIIEGTTAYFICKLVKQYDGGDHVILLGEVEEYAHRHGDVLVFHSGKYRVVKPHPDFPE
jgi:flavin reductase (DIM6/NTAB) family NADH-FMN oxidoreductase RutF